MITRRVTQVARDRHGRIVALGNPAEPWSPVDSREAIAQIVGGTYRYATGDPATPRFVYVAVGSARSYLRSGPDAEEENNLDNLPDLTEGNPLTGGYDLAVQLSEPLLARTLLAMHSARSTTHQATRVVDGSVAELSLGPHQPQLSNDATEIRVRVRVCAWTRPLDDLGIIESSGTGSVNARVVVTGIPATAGGPATIWTDWSPTAASDVDFAAPAGTDPEIAARAVLDWAQLDGGGRFIVPQIAGIGTPTTVAAQFAADSGGQLWTQVAVDFDRLTIAQMPDPQDIDGDWALLMSRSLVTTQVRRAIADTFGGDPPPPEGAGRPEIANSVFLTRLDVDLVQDRILIAGRVNSDSAADPDATFTAAIPVEISAGGTLRSGEPDIDVSVGGFLASIGNFFSGGAITRAITNGIREALGGGARRPSFISADFLGQVAALSTTRNVTIRPVATSVLVQPAGIIVVGTATTDIGDAANARAVLTVSVTGGRVLLDAAGSWSPGHFIQRATFDFGDGSAAVTLAGTDLRLAAVAAVAPGNYTATVTVQDDIAREASAQRRYRVRA
jgi:hypothetical protein